MDNPFQIMLDRLEQIEKGQRRIEERLADLQITVPYQSDDIDLKEFCKMTGYKEKYAYQLVEKRVVPSRKVGKFLRFSRTEIEIWLKSGRPDIMQQAVDQMASNFIVNGVLGSEAKKAS